MLAIYITKHKYYNMLNSQRIYNISIIIKTAKINYIKLKLLYIRGNDHFYMWTFSKNRNKVALKSFSITLK